MTETNLAIAKRFGEIAELLAVQRANPHRIRAYRRAAETLTGLTEDVGALAERDELRKVPGIGRELAAKIREFLQTGTIRSHQELKAPLPPEVAAWAELPGLSESVVHYLYSRLGIRTLEDLETLAASRLLRTLPGFTGSEPALLAAIQRERASGPEA
jgi:DNA polymerase (family 10)